MASNPVSKYSFNVQDFDELAGLTESIFGGEQCSEYENTIYEKYYAQNGYSLI